MSAAMPLVSIVMPVRNEALHIADAIARLDKLDYPRELIEIIVVDGASSDGTAEIVRELAALLPKRHTCFCHRDFLPIVGFNRHQWAGRPRPYLRNGMPMSCSSRRPSSSVFAVVTMVTAMPRILSTFS